MGNVKYYRGTEAQIKSQIPDVDGIYFSSDTNKIFRSKDGSSFEELGGATVVQTTGVSTTSTMSQLAITEALANKVNVGDGITLEEVSTGQPNHNPTAAGQIYITEAHPAAGTYSGSIFLSAYSSLMGNYVWYEVATACVTLWVQSSGTSTTTAAVPSNTTTSTSTSTSTSSSTSTTTQNTGVQSVSEGDSNTLESVLNSYLDE